MADLAGVMKATLLITCGVTIPLLLCYTVTVSACPGVTLGDLCYYFPEPNVYKNWNDAQATCQTVGGNLTTPSTSAVDDAVAELMKQQAINSFWLGGRQSETPWTWVPSDLELEGQGCYEDDPSNPDMEVYLGVFADLTPSTCMARCEARGYAFAAAQNGVQCWCGNTFIPRVYAADCTVACVGDTSLVCGGPGNNFVYRINGAYGNWALGQPNNYRGNQKCGAMDNYLGQKLADESCGKLIRYFCTLQDVLQCNGVGFHLFGSTCFYLSTEDLDWYSARDACVKLGGDLTWFTDDVTHTSLRTIIDTTTNITTDAQFWVGLARTVWAWASGTPFAYTNWAEEEPNHDTVGCTVMLADAGYKWGDEDCDLFHQFACAIPTALAPTTTTEEVTTTQQATTTQQVTTTQVVTTTQQRSSSVTSTTSQYSTLTPPTTTAGLTTATDDVTTSPIDVTTHTTDFTTSSGEDPDISTPTLGGTISSTQGLDVSTSSGGVGPGAAASTAEDTSDLRLVLYVVLGVLLVVALILSIILILAYATAKRRQNRVADLRHLATIPNFGMTSAYSNKDGDSILGKQRDFPYEEFR